MKPYTNTVLLLLAALLSQSAHSADPASRITFFHNDLLGSPVAATDEAGNLKWRKDYKPYGAESTNSENDGQNNIGFTGHVDDSETGLTYMQARYYDPAIGRFLSVDPVGFTESNPMSFNRYSYANNNPYKYIDPDGREIKNPDYHWIKLSTMNTLQKLDANTPGVDFNITSGVRSEQRNKEVGGAAHSPHLVAEGGTGMDANIIVSGEAKASGENIGSVAQKAVDEGFTGVITYTKENATSVSQDGRIHLDQREGSTFHRDTSKNGQGKTQYNKASFGEKK